MYEEMIQHVKATLEARVLTDPLASDNHYPFRNRFEHTMRVYRWAMRMQEELGGDREVIAIAAIFHDIAKCVSDRPHAEVGAEMADEYLTEHNYPIEGKEKILRAIRYHSSKRAGKELDLTLEEKILIDADALDEIGAITVIWDAMATALEAEPSYTKVYERITKMYEKTKRQEQYFLTEAGRRFFRERLQVIERFLQDLHYELGLELQLTQEQSPA